MSEESSNTEEETTKRKTATLDTESKSAVCPVCLLDDVPLFRGSCQHEVCLPCIRQILATPMRRPRRQNNSPLLSDEDAHLDVPTRGRCPMCRSEICLFEMEKTSASKSDDASAEQSSEVQMVIEKNHSIVSTGLKGRVYVLNRKVVGEESIHFPSGDDEEEGNENITNALPFVDFTRCENFKLLNGEKLTGKKYFEPDCHFHEPTRTFHGRIKLGDSCSRTLHGSSEWEYILAFSAEYHFVARGVKVEKRHICQDPNCKRLECKFPLDGRWQVSLPDQEDRRDTTLVVHNNRWSERLSPMEPTMLGPITFKDNKYPCTFFTGMSRLVSTHDFSERNVQVGESFDFVERFDDSSLNQQGRMAWTRETDGPEQHHISVINFGSGTSQDYYHESSEINGGEAKSHYHSDVPWGNTFCQGFRVGLASYHFMDDPEQGVYISYEHQQTSQWPPLDNGNPVPARIWFSETSYDAEARIFRGKIDWQGRHETTWQGSRWWRYEMHFDDKFACIVGGYVMSVPVGSDVEQEMSVFGLELLYINAGLVELCQQGSEFGFGVVEQTIETLENGILDLNEQIRGGRRSMRQPASMFGLLMLMQRATGGSGEIGYPLSFSAINNS